MLEVVDLRVAYGGIEALKGVTLSVKEGSITCLIGANGAGKTTLLRAISGLLPVRGGRIQYAGQDITGRPAEDVVRLGISQVPEGRGNFTSMSVRDNLLLGAYRLSHATRRDEMEADLRRIFELFPALQSRQRQLAGTLSGGEQQMLAMGRVLMARPSVILLDEPSMGLAPLLVREILRTIQQLPARGTTPLLVEQNARAALRIADFGYVMENGRVALQGSARDLLADPRVRRAYLGQDRTTSSGPVVIPWDLEAGDEP
jgi:branched-chain amino acid transport system ATP-binding protein